MSSEELIRESRRHPKIDDRGMMDVPFLVLVLLLVAIGLLMMFSASYVRANYETGNSSPLFYPAGRLCRRGPGRHVRRQPVQLSHLAEAGQGNLCRQCFAFWWRFSL